MPTYGDMYTETCEKCGSDDIRHNSLLIPVSSEYTTATAAMVENFAEKVGCLPNRVVK